ncbi:hypothetical protein HK100_003718 [Physocladia obscura]|uniref:protein-tyrosine-phosphatase n=1 Tax=Physocladia obscura TaxID=109957 RepID=A0AAD5XJQ2_9FUNG|nr:hypothetical protein HK100_003718 [Physocladia obscura]
MSYSSSTNTCSITFTVDKDMTQPVYLYYRLTNFYQNHRRYVKSFDANQLSNTGIGSNGSPPPTPTSVCSPLSRPTDAPVGTYKWVPTVNGVQTFDANAVIYPCGLIANSYFSDVIGPLVGTSGNVTFSQSNIAWPSDAAKFQKSSLFTQGTISGNITTMVFPPPQWITAFPEKDFSNGYTFTNYPDVSTMQRFQVWMRPAGLPNFRKLWGSLSSDLLSGEYTVQITDNFDVNTFGGTKSIVISTVSILGGKNPFLGIAYIVVGVVCWIFGLLFLARHMIKPRKLGDYTYLSWNQPQRGPAGGEGASTGGPSGQPTYQPPYTYFSTQLLLITTLATATIAYFTTMPARTTLSPMPTGRNQHLPMNRLMTQITYKHLRFVIFDAPTDSNVSVYADELLRRNVTLVVRACDPTYTAAILEARGIRVRECAFADGAVPSRELIDAFLVLCRAHFNTVNSDPDEIPAIGVHCVAGLGRAPILVAMALIDAGMTALEAAEFIRERRRGAFNSVQLKYLVDEYKPRSTSSQIGGTWFGFKKKNIATLNSPTPSLVAATVTGADDLLGGHSPIGSEIGDEETGNCVGISVQGLPMTHVVTTKKTGFMASWFGKKAVGA